MEKELKLRDFVPEHELLEILGMKKEGLAALRAKGLPVVRVNGRVRFYQESDIVTFFLFNKYSGGIEVAGNFAPEPTYNR